MILGAVLLAVLAAALAGPVPRVLAAARWPVRSPVAAIVLWQAVGLAGGLAAIGAGLLIGVAPLADDLAAGLLLLARHALDGHPLRALGAAQVAGLLWAAMLFTRLLSVLLVSSARTLAARRRHRDLVDLVGTPWPALGGARVLDAPEAVAYCLPGLRPRVVLSAGTLSLLGERELAAVLAHEHAHVVQRHDLVVLPFVALGATLPWLPGVRRAQESVAALIEMLADDRARQRHDARDLAAALVRVGGAGVPSGALGVAEAAVVTRVRRLLDPPPPAARGVQVAAYAGSLALLGLPTALLALPVLL